MKKRISDLLDDFPAPQIQVETSTPLSSKRIRELTMKQVNPSNRAAVKRNLLRLLAAAAVISLLTITAVAVEEVFHASAWFQGILNRQLEEDRDMVDKGAWDVTVRETLSQGQLDVVDSLGGSFQPQSATDQGTTMTLTAAYGDAHVVHLYLEVTAPQGTVLPDGIQYTFWDRNRQDVRMFSVEEDAPYDHTGIGFLWIEALPDGDPTDNIKDFHLTIEAPGQHQGLQMNDGYGKYIHISGIYQQVLDARDGYELLAPGAFTFDFSLANEARAVTLDTQGCSYGGDKTRTWTHNSPCDETCRESLTGETDPDTGLPIHTESWSYTVTVETLALSPLSAEWEVRYTCTDETRVCGLDFQVVMKDGTSPMQRRVWIQEDVNASKGVCLFTTPIDFDEIDYILIGDTELGSTQRVYLP